MDVKVNVQHLHPIFVHFPQALFPVAFAALCIYLLTGVREFETGAFVAALFGAAGGAGDDGDGILRLVEPLPGVHDQRVQDQDHRVVRPDGAGARPAVLLRAFHPDLAVLPLAGLGWAYFGLLAACTATCVVLGYYGGKLVFH